MTEEGDRRFLQLELPASSSSSKQTYNRPTGAWARSGSFNKGPREKKEMQGPANSPQAMTVKGTYSGFFEPFSSIRSSSGNLTHGGGFMRRPMTAPMNRGPAPSHGGYRQVPSTIGRDPYSQSQHHEPNERPSTSIPRINHLPSSDDHARITQPLMENPPTLSHPIESFMLSTQGVPVRGLLREGGEKNEHANQFNRTLQTDARAFMTWQQISKRPQNFVKEATGPGSPRSGRPSPSRPWSSPVSSSSRIMSKQVHSSQALQPALVLGHSLPEQEVALPSQSHSSTLSPSILANLTAGLRKSHSSTYHNSSSAGPWSSPSGISLPWEHENHPSSSLTFKENPSPLSISGKVTQLSPRPPSGAAHHGLSCFLTSEIASEHRAEREALDVKEDDSGGLDGDLETVEYAGMRGGETGRDVSKTDVREADIREADIREATQRRPRRAKGLRKASCPSQ